MQVVEPLPEKGLPERWRVPQKKDIKGWKDIEALCARRGPFPRPKIAVIVDLRTYADYKVCALGFLSKPKFLGPLNFNL